MPALPRASDPIPAAGSHRPQPSSTAAPLKLTDAGAELAQQHIAGLLRFLGEDPTREGLQRTPQRVVRSLQMLTAGYRQDLGDVVNGAVFAEEYSEMVVVRDIELYSLCEHHLLPFFGRAHVAYIPAGRLVGLSKLGRIVDLFARRVQLQERLTIQIAEAIDTVLAPQGVAVVIEASHLCMMMRGVEKQNSQTLTSSMRGVFLSDPGTRAEFMNLLHCEPGRQPVDGPT